MALLHTQGDCQRGIWLLKHVRFVLSGCHLQLRAVGVKHVRFVLSGCHLQSRAVVVKHVRFVSLGGHLQSPAVGAGATRSAQLQTPRFKCQTNVKCQMKRRITMYKTSGQGSECITPVTPLILRGGANWEIAAARDPSLGLRTPRNGATEYHSTSDFEASLITQRLPGSC